MHHLIKIENKQNKWLGKKEEKAQEWLYSIHHMHHFHSKNGVRHELHHCYLFEKANKQGEKYGIIHQIFSDIIYHCLDSEFEGKLFDHANRAYKIIKRTIKGKKIYEIT
ncbi:MAG: hypothetical protein ABIH10_01440 [Spirochaetota bacterium]